MKFRSMLALLLAVASGCDDANVVADGGVDSGSLQDGGGMMVDAGVITEGDAGESRCTSPAECGANQGCVRGTCIDTCAADVSAWGDLLEEGLVPVQNYCMPAAARSVKEGSPETVYDLVQKAEGTTTILELRRWTLSEPTPVSIATVRVDEPDGDPWGTSVPFAGSYIALSDNEALFGYSVFAEGVPGELFRVNLTSGDVVRYNAPGNFGAAWMGEDFVVDGLGFGEVDSSQGLYGYDSSLMRVVYLGAGLGSSSGSVLVDDDYVLAGGYESAPILLAVTRTEVEDALASNETLDFGAVGSAPIGATTPSAFWTPGPGLFAASDYMGAMRVWTRTWSSGTLTLSNERAISSDSSVFSWVHEVGDDQMLIGHSNGVLLVSD